MNNKLKKIIIATGGTGGHVFPAYSLAKHFHDNKINVQIITDKRGLKYCIITFIWFPMVSEAVRGSL